MNGVNIQSWLNQLEVTVPRCAIPSNVTSLDCVMYHNPSIQLSDQFQCLHHLSLQFHNGGKRGRDWLWKLQISMKCSSFNQLQRQKMCQISNITGRRDWTHPIGPGKPVWLSPSIPFWQCHLKLKEYPVVQSYWCLTIAIVCWMLWYLQSNVYSAGRGQDSLRWQWSGRWRTHRLCWKNGRNRWGLGRCISRVLEYSDQWCRGKMLFSPPPLHWQGEASGVGGKEIQGWRRLTEWWEGVWRYCDNRGGLGYGEYIFESPQGPVHIELILSYNENTHSIIPSSWFPLKLS